MQADRTEIPAGYCQCGCGERTTISPQNNPRFGWVKGEPKKYVWTHNGKRGRSTPRHVVEDRGYVTSCWIWQGPVAENGYGEAPDPRKGPGRSSRAHRVYWERVNGPIPTGLVLDHLCRQRQCVNPDHLEPVTHEENCRRGLGAKLTVDGVRLIRARLAAGERGCDLAREYGVSPQIVSQIKSRARWKDV